MDTSPLAPLAVTICVYLRMLKSSPLKILRILRAAGDPDDRMRPLSLTGALSFYRPGPGPRHIFVDPGAAAVLGPGIREREKIPGRPHT